MITDASLHAPSAAEIHAVRQVFDARVVDLQQDGVVPRDLDPLQVASAVPLIVRKVRDLARPLGTEEFSPATLAAVTQVAAQLTERLATLPPDFRHLRRLSQTQSL